MGRQVRIEISENDYFLDLLFYHLHLRCCAFELSEVVPDDLKTKLPTVEEMEKGLFQTLNEEH